MLNTVDRIQKRVFDLLLSVIGITLTWWIMLLAWVVATIETRSNGLFMQERVGKKGKRFQVFKIKTMKSIPGIDTTVTTNGDIRITISGTLFRKTKIDELPQLFNVLFGTMSFVGARPDVPGFADKLKGSDRVILELAPGITGPSSLKYKDEEELLAKQEDPEGYNREVIWPDKVVINKMYLKNWTLKKDIEYIVKTIIG